MYLLIDELNLGVNTCTTPAALGNNNVSDERYFQLALFERLVEHMANASIARGRGETGEKENEKFELRVELRKCWSQTQHAGTLGPSWTWRFCR